MMDQTLPARMAASLAVALAVHGTGESYGLVLKGLNEFAAAAGVTGAAAVRIAHSTNASTPLTMLAHWAPQAGHARATVTPDRTARTPKQVSIGASSCRQMEKSRDASGS
jgi:phosphatidate phosphatase APP1